MINKILELNKASLYATRILVCQFMFCQPKMHFSVITKPRATSQKTPMMKQNQRGQYNHGKNRSENIKTQASYNNPHNRQFPIYRGTDNPDVDDGSTGELEGIYGKMPVLLSRFSQLPTKSLGNGAETILICGGSVR